MTHMGCSSLPEALIKQSLRAGLSDGWGGSMAGTRLFPTFCSARRAR